MLGRMPQGQFCSYVDAHGQTLLISSACCSILGMERAIDAVPTHWFITWDNNRPLTEFVDNV